jgi:aspartate aminotransferase
MAVPNAVLQYALPELDPLRIDLGLLQRKRDRLVGGLRELGYTATLPEGTFYVLVRTPVADDWAFAAGLAEQKLYALPGRVCELPGYLRLSLTASEAMIEQALPRFAQALNG